MNSQRRTTSRPCVPAIERVLGKRFPVLDDGFVRVVDYMGSDNAIVQAARVSYGRGTKKVQDDRHLIRYLLRHNHTTPFEMCEIKFHVRVPMDVWRQWIRHRTANVNEYSTRYSLAIDAIHETRPSQWRLQSPSTKQGSVGNLSPTEGTILSQTEALIHKHSRDVYRARIESGIAREQARKDLPLSTYTEAYWKIDLHNLLHFLHLRMSEHAQLEIRQYASTIGKSIVSRWCPATWNAFLDYRIQSMLLTRQEASIAAALVSKDKRLAIAIAHDSGWCDATGVYGKTNRERGECERKLIALSLRPPWTRRREHSAQKELRAIKS